MVKKKSQFIKTHNNLNMYAPNNTASRCIKQNLINYTSINKKQESLRRLPDSFTETWRPT